MKYDEYAPSLGFSKVGNVYTKECKGFNVYLKNWQYLIYQIPAFYVPTNKEITSEELKKIEKEAFGNVGALFTLNVKNDTLIMTLNDGNKKDQKVLDKILVQINHVCTCLQNDGYEKMTLCPVCKKEGDYAPFGDNFCPMHLECFVSYTKKLEDIVEKQKGFSPKYVLSIALSLILALIGLLPSFLLCYFKYDYFTGLIALVPVLSTLGYFLAKAPNKKWLQNVTGVMVFIIVIGFTCFSVYFMSQGKGLSLSSYIVGGKMVGLRKIIFSAVLSLGGFGGTRFLNKFRFDYAKELEKFKK